MNLAEMHVPARVKQIFSDAFSRFRLKKPVVGATPQSVEPDVFQAKQAALLAKMLREMKEEGTTIQENGSHRIPSVAGLPPQKLAGDAQN